MTIVNTQETFQVRLGWGQKGLSELPSSEIVIIVDALSHDAEEETRSLARSASQQETTQTVFLASLRNASATAQAAFQTQILNERRTPINLILTGDQGLFLVEDYLAAGAVANALTSLGIDHSSPDAAVAAESFRSLKKALKHLLSASATGQLLKSTGRSELLQEATELDAEDEASSFI